MVVLIAGASHTGKTALAQRLLEKYHFPYLSIDHLKMGLIRSGNTNLRPEDGAELQDYLWPIVREMIKTVIENGQNLVVEGCYIPFDWKKDFGDEYLRAMRYVCLILSERYITNHFEQIQAYASVVEKRLDDSGCAKDALLEDNARNLAMCVRYGCYYVLVDDAYHVAVEL